MPRSKLIAFGIVLVAVVLAGGVAQFLVLSKKNMDTKGAKDTVSTRQVKAAAVEMVVEVDPDLHQKTVSQKNQEAGQLWELTQPEDGNREFVMSAFYEQGDSLKKLTGYTKQSLRDSVVANINLQLPKQYPEYKELTQRNLTINGIEASETVFTYETSGVTVKQRLLLLFKNSETAVYIRAQAKADEYEEINKQYFEPIFSSAKFE